jgi:hypothetical protein
VRGRRLLFGSRTRALLAVVAVLQDAAAAASVHAGEIDTLLFGSLDVGGDLFLTTGAKVGLPTLRHDGFTLLACFGGGRRQEYGPAGDRQRYTVGAAAVIGYQWFYDWGVVATFAGPDVALATLVDRRGPAVRPAEIGLRLHGEVWARPTEATLLQVTAVASTARDSLWARAAWGYRLWDTYIGPEIAVYADATGYIKRGLGLHGTDFALGPYAFRASAGLQSETGRRSAWPYVALSVWAPL